MLTLLQDFRYGLRILRKSPAFTAVAVLTLALGMGANTVVISILNAFYLRTAPVRSPQELVAARQTHRGIALPEYYFLRDNNRSFTGLATEYPTAHVYLQENDDSAMLLSAIVSSNYFDLLGVKPYLGRLFVPADEEAKGLQVVVLSYSLWSNRFGEDRGILGTTITLNGVPTTVVGVAPPEFHRLFSGYDDDLWLPSGAASAVVPHCNPPDYRCDFFNGVIGRLKPGTKLENAREELNELNRRWEAIYPDLDKSSFSLFAARGVEPSNRRELSQLPATLAAIVALLLLIGCANVSGLLLARASVRRKELATRLALGASRARLIRQLLTEATIIAALGTAMGTLLLVGASHWLSTFPFASTEGFRSFYNIGFDPLVFLAIVVLSVMTVFVFGLIPAIRASALAPIETLKEIGTTPGENLWSRRILVAGQVALAVSLCAGATMIVRSLDHVLTGKSFDPRQLAVVRVSPYRLGYAPAKSAQLQTEALRRLAALPSVQAVSFGQLMPWWESWEESVALPGQAAGTRETLSRVHYNSIAPNYLHTLNIPLLAGREFSDADRKGAPDVVIVNESLARRLWLTGDPVGQTVLIGGTPCVVVGVAQDAQYNPAGDSTHLFFYRPYWQIQNNGDSRFVIRTARDPAAMLREIKSTIRAIDPKVPIGEDSTLVQALLNDFGSLRLTRAVLLFAGSAAAMLSAIGLYSVLAFLVARRTREIGIRLALGAPRQRVLLLFLQQGLRVALAGTAAGFVIALIAVRLLAALLYGISSGDKLSAVGICLLLFLVCGLASYIPARRATKVDPISALRYE